ncbi:ATP-dependent zinc metalloprotease FtsH [Striga asiatica]|uniref:ATP-dependent zinc metalloprotease FtsH n=1 Tax=Striga asiatica TaxID=4170 RepID=A0A5A7R692_STRAF|nr:ATP-dependent zinc metalloprotease FtsH [Striga asiatica]
MLNILYIFVRMIPHKTKRGEVALARLKVLRIQVGHKYCLLCKLSSEVRWNNYEIIRIRNGVFDHLVMWEGVKSLLNRRTSARLFWLLISRTFQIHATWREITKGNPSYRITWDRKTLLAKAIAGEAGVPFFYSAGVRGNAPCIVFIDEIDVVASYSEAVGRPYKENAASVARNFIVMTATNLPDILDPALTRPDRFDRHVSFYILTSKNISVRQFLFINI